LQDLPAIATVGVFVESVFGAKDNASILEVTPRALEAVLEIWSSETDPEKLALWIEVSGISNNNYSYDVYFQNLSDAGPDDVIVVLEGISVVVPSASVAQITGSKLDLGGEDGSGGLMILNPNTPSSPKAELPPELPPELQNADLSDPVSQRVIRVLQEEINPAIAAHGGRADLVAVAGSVAYLKLSGGCQGCGMASVTLSQGIEVAIKEAVPEIVTVADVTDHINGANPFYGASKK
jgi:Fe/S biogenesis protein NfuA